MTNKAYAREDKEKSKMDGAQLTGSASTYARKYALNGLFCIDDTKDADTDEYTKVQETRGKKIEARGTRLEARGDESAPAQPAMTAEMRKTLDDAKSVEELYEAFAKLPQNLREHQQVKDYCAELKAKLEAQK